MTYQKFLSAVVLVVMALCACRAEAAGQQTPPRSEMTSGQAAILGVVEGLTEYLPVSSTGHLLLAQRVMGIGEGASLTEDERRRDKEAADAYAICIQAGAIIAVLGLYFRRVRQIFAGMFGRDPVGLRLLVGMAAGFLPAAVIGLAFNSQIKQYLFGPWPVVAAWLVGGLAILAVSSRTGHDREKRAMAGIPLDELTWKMALIIGLAQCIAMWPGVSRSLITIVGGLLVGLSLPAAVEFSFLLGVITLGAATAYDALKHGEIMLQTFDVSSIAIGLVFAFISAVVSIKWMVAYLNNHGLAIFGYYRLILAFATAGLLAAGII